MKKFFTVFLTVILTMTTLFGLAGMTFAADVHDQYMMNVEVSSPDGFCNFRTGPGQEYEVILSIDNKTELKITAITEGKDGLIWGHTVYNGSSGWVASSTIKVLDILNTSNAVYYVIVTNSKNISLRKGPGTEYDEISGLKKGQELQITQTMVNSYDGRAWGRTVVDGYAGWVSLSWTERKDSVLYNQLDNVMMNSNEFHVKVDADDYLNFRRSPALSSDILAQLKKGTELCVTAIYANSSDGLVWGLATYNGMSGWVSMGGTYVKEVDNASYYQYDVKVTDSANLTLREGPGTEFEVLKDYVKKGTTLTITQTVANGFDGRIWGKTKVKGVEGWVSLSWTSRD